MRDYCGHAHFDIGPTWGESQNLIDFADLVRTLKIWQFDAIPCLIHTDTGMNTIIVSYLIAKFDSGKWKQS